MIGKDRGPGGKQACLGLFVKIKKIESNRMAKPMSSSIMRIKF
jgi:hypothetical protein